VVLLGFGTAAAWARAAMAPWLTLATAAMLGVTVRAGIQALRLSSAHLATVEALAMAIDAKDQTAYDHVRRVQIYATGLGEALGMSAHDVEGLRTAALLHDAGQLAVPEHILAKPGRLTEEEFDRVRIHPAVGAGIISGIDYPYPVASLILSHHERWDGCGYPNGLAGEQIPLGARALAVAEYFDSLTTPRPYHLSVSLDAATDMLRQESGHAFDPSVVEVFEGILPDLQRRVRHLAPTPAVTTLSSATDGPAEMSLSPTEAFRHIAHAHHEIYALYDIAQTMGVSLGVEDAMSVIANKLRPVVPYSTCALFLFDESSDQLRCRFATGADTSVMRDLVIDGGQGAVGTVARFRRTVVNAHPSTDYAAAGSRHTTALQSSLISPLVFNDRLVGTLAVYHVARSFYGDQHRRLLERVCEQAAAVVHNSALFEQTREDSWTDPMTGLPNTRYMLLHLSRELARAGRGEAEVTFMVLDLDAFKDINDTHGHHVGDQVLRLVATSLRAAIRPYDICARYAGDEFVVVLSGCGREEAESKRRELLDAIDDVRVALGPNTTIGISASIGAAVFPHDGTSYEHLLAAADARMYHHKNTRRPARPAIEGRHAGGEGATGLSAPVA
jgi:diguanylate cyclase (GGDEF)-like protein